MNKNESPTNFFIKTVLKEVSLFETEQVPLSDTKNYNQYQTYQTIKTHQNKGFLTKLAAGQVDDREFYDIGTSMIETRVVNIDLDDKDLDPYTVNPNYIPQEFLAKALIRHYLKQTNHGEKINEIEYMFLDEGNVVVRKVFGKNNNGEIYLPVQLSNLYVIDQTAKTLEDTTVIEKEIMNQTTLRKMKEWSNVDKVLALSNVGTSEELPYYEVYYRYGEVSTADYNEIQKELDGKQIKESEDYIQCLITIVKAKRGKEYNGVAFDSDGIIVFAEKLTPEIIKISDELEITKYKPYEEAHIGKYNGRWMREGDREVLIPYQNRANELGNQIRDIMKLASKMVFWSTDKNIAGKNVLSSIKNGQVLETSDLQLLNNVFPNLSLFSEEWNRNINEAQKSLKAFEVASGESLPSSTSATAVSVQNQQIGKYYDFIREKLGLFFACVFKRWVIPELLKKTKRLEKMEIIGDPSYMEEYAEIIARGWLFQNLPLFASKGGITQEQATQLVDMKKKEIMKNKRQFLDLEKGFFNDVELYVGLNPSGELFNKQARISNGLSLLQYISNPGIMNDSQSKDIVMEIANELGFKISSKSSQQTAQQTQPTQPTNPQSLPMKEQPQMTDSNLL